MAENILETRILLRYGTYNDWMNSEVILKRGEAAVATFPNRVRVIESLSDSSPDNTPPAIGIKIGDGQHYFYQLPWVQAISADVYQWAKQASKPSYTAQEIQGLQSYIENMISGDVDVTIAPRIYQIVQGKNEDVNKYYLQYKENSEDAEWIIDTSSYIDLNDLNNLINWIGRTNIKEYPSMIYRTAEQIQYFLEQLNQSDNEVENQFITSVSENAGIITVSRAQPTFNNIKGIASVEKGGTGLSFVEPNSVLVGNGSSNLTTIPIADTVDNNNYLVPNRVIKNYVDNAVSGLSGAMHFIGEATVAITGAVDPQIGGYVFANAQPGDVILWDRKEYVWDGGAWILLGDEGSYAIKGSIKDADIAEDADISQSKIVNLITDLSSKVDIIEGKGLSSNDYTTEEKNKLTDIEEGAQKNLIEHLFINGTEQNPTIVDGKTNSINLIINSFDETRARKLDSIEYYANVNKIEHLFVNNVEQVPSTINSLSKSINLNINGITDSERNKLAAIEANAQVNKVERLIINGITYYPNNNKAINLSLNSQTLNLDSLAGAQVPLGNTTEEVSIVNNKLQLARIAKTGDISDIQQESNEYVTLYCGSSTTVI